MLHGRKISYCFLTGRDAQESYNNFFNWLDHVYTEAQMPCDGLVEAFEERKKIKGCYHHLNGEEADRFMKILQSKLRAWGSRCDPLGMSAESVIKSSCSRRVQLSFTPQMVKTFLDFPYPSC